MNETTITVSGLNRYLKAKFSSDPHLSSISVQGELSNFKHHIKSGHFYFTLKDEFGSIRAVMFKSNAMRVPFTPEDGMKVIVRGSVQVYERDGIYQIYCETMVPDGIGALYLAFEQRKKKLEAAGLFDPAHKRPLPVYPQCIGIVTSKTGAALQDILNILKRRYPLVRVILFPVLVQGEGAPKSIAAAIREASACGLLDVMIVGRGGGSMEDLWAFNDEDVAYAAYESRVPVVSAVGHEVDFTILDFVADLRAPTPSAAAELCSPDIEILRDRIASLSGQLVRLFEHQATQSAQRLQVVKTKLAALSPEERIKSGAQTLDTLKTRLDIAASHRLESQTKRLAAAARTLDAVSPLKVLARGYSITMMEHDEVLFSAGEVLPGARIRTILSDGELFSIVQETKQKAVNT